MIFEARHVRGAAADELTHQVFLPAQRHSGQDRAVMSDVRELHFHVAHHAGLGEQSSPRGLLVVERLFSLLRKCARGRKHNQRGCQRYVPRAALHGLPPFVGFWASLRLPFAEGKSIACVSWEAWGGLRRLELVAPSPKPARSETNFENKRHYLLIRRSIPIRSPFHTAWARR